MIDNNCLAVSGRLCAIDYQIIDAEVYTTMAKVKLN